MKKWYLIFFSMLLILTGCMQTEKKQDVSGSTEKVELTISAAASLQDALKEIAADFEKKHPNIKITYNYGASGALQQQISHGAPVDLFFSAAEDKYDKLVKDGLINKNNGTDLVRNELVLIVPSHSDVKGFNDLAKSEQFSIGTPESVPAGKYAKETLENLKLWNEVEEKVVYAKDVRQVLTYVETGNVDAGIVYKTDAMISKKVKVAATADENTHSPIVYPVGVVKKSPHQKEAKLFYDYLQEKEILQIFKEYGFSTVN